ncbi:MAG: hypothetical protein A2788_01165 [Candidatus Abawacabacteria bacterium RIFCSPHIGHO2_01_FULL_46_8]|uniref:Uncharacterized protein n=1 Tax=Candidatus Abawacabacteria bacterium RIFCSPHIGHO2_01_FULL_46_8 TaxID=1817815 RepID=A0A1F4XLG7_9BACT|nr:MAG: hypothetical protein A2788_01165 [Candidatus Abawacabacteria bacterium RIFCSPHIGHO2_01_FULL_46_8]
MLTTVHAAAGIALAGRLKRPVWLIVAAFSSHLVLDALPHWDRILPYNLASFFQPNWLWLDFALAGLVTFALPAWFKLRRQCLYWLGAFFAVLPDGLTFLDRFIDFNPWGWHDAFFALHGGIQLVVTFVPGILFQLGTLAIMLFLFIHKAKQDV